MLEDRDIVALFFSRNEEAIIQSKKKYGDYCLHIADSILRNKEDSEEILNDTWLRAWNSIPPQRPEILRLFLAKITRNLSLDRLRRSNSQKRASTFKLAYEELSECLASTQSPEDSIVARELEKAIKRFLGQCGKTERDIFLRRYFFFDSTKEIADRYSIRESNVLNLLSRTRKKLKEHLRKEGWLT